MLPFIHWLYDDTFIVDSEITELDIVPKCITWNVNKKINSNNNLYIQLICQEDNIKSFFPNHDYYNFMSSHLEIMKKTKIPLNKKNYYRSINESVLIDFYNDFNEFSKIELQSNHVPKDYQNLIEIFKLLNYIEEKPLNLRGQLKNHNPYLKLVPFTKTQRLRTVAPFFPIYNIQKEHRVDILPRNDFILEIDYNAAEFRIFMALLGLEQPQNDAYEEIQRIFNLDSRTDAKQKVFEIIYSNHYHNDSILSIVNKYLDNNQLITPYGTSIFLEEKSKLINYLCQSTCSSLIFEKSIECIKFIENNNLASRLLFCFHDAIVFDLHRDDIHKIAKLQEIISNTRFGLFKIRSKIGTNYYNLKEIE